MSARTQNGRATELPEPSLRVLARLAALMRQRFTGRVEIELGEGGVRGFRESRTWKPGEMDPPDSRDY